VTRPAAEIEIDLAVSAAENPPMKHVVLSLLAVAVTSLACLAPRDAAAGPPSGAYQVTVSGSQEIFLPSGSIHDCASNPNGSVGVCFDVDFAADELGAFGGGGTVDVSGIASGTLTATATGRVVGTVEKPRASVSLRFSGGIDALGYPGTGRGVIALGCQRDPLNPPLLACKGRIGVCGSVRGLGSACVGAPIATSIGAEGGPWTLTLDLATDPKNRVTGLAEVTLATGQSIDFDVVGTYNARGDFSLTRFSPDAGTGLLRFKLGGQVGSVDLSTLP
jgi:hypothetical protein